MTGNVPLELVVAAAVCVILVNSPVARGRPGVIFFTEWAEPTTNRARRTPGEIGAEAESPDISIQRKRTGIKATGYNFILDAPGLRDEASNFILLSTLNKIKYRHISAVL